MVLRRQTLGFRTCQEGGALGSTAGFQMETLEGSTLGWGWGGRWVKAAETEAYKDSQPPVTQSLTKLRACPYSGSASEETLKEKSISQNLYGFSYIIPSTQLK